MTAIALAIYLGLYNIAYTYRKCNDKEYKLHIVDVGIYLTFLSLFFLSILLGR